MMWSIRDEPPFKERRRAIYKDLFTSKIQPAISNTTVFLMDFNFICFRKDGWEPVHWGG